VDRAGIKNPPRRTIQIDLSGKCNHFCTYCVYRNAISLLKGITFSCEHFLKKETALKVAEDILETSISWVNITCVGEFTLYPWSLDFVRRLKDLPLSISTNGFLFNNNFLDLIKNLRDICFVMDASSPKIYSRVHRINHKHFFPIIRNIAHLVKNASKNHFCKVGVSFTIVPENIDDMETAARFYRDIGLNYIRYTLPDELTLDDEILKKVLEEIENAKGLSRDGFEVVSNHNNITYAIGNDGRVYMPGVLKYVKHACIGNIYHNSLKDILLC
jgi:molybdenum cofactor biosynthesis enzyme MoaA